MSLPTLTVEVADEAAQVALGEQLARVCGDQAVLFLRGDLGAGKTTLMRGILRGFGYQGAVKSPTYTLIEPYELPDRRVSHLDLYRVADPEELEYLGLRELLDEPTIVVVEWPERGDGWLPQADLDISITYRGTGRSVAISAFTAPGAEWLRALAKNLQ